MELQELGGRKVDVVSGRGLKPRIRERVLTEAVPLLRDPGERLRDILGAISQIKRYSGRGQEVFEQDESRGRAWGRSRSGWSE
jgi:hypothetical protein